ncbi:hypothetical protein [Bradyrhizobium sp. CCBAU 45394]|nr:hypothetical protein [Bradyrhizobium sp. CCBAU 45394]
MREANVSSISPYSMAALEDVAELGRDALVEVQQAHPLVSRSPTFL